MGHISDEMTNLLTVEVSVHDGVPVIEVTGEVDAACDEPIRAVLMDQLERGPTGLVVDLTRVDFFGSTGVQLLVDAIVRAEDREVVLAVAACRRVVLHTLEITLMDQRVPVHPTVADAVASVQGAMSDHRETAGR